MSETQEPIHDELEPERFEDAADREPSAPAFDDLEAQAAYWRARFEEERELLAKLWVAYRDVENELEAYREETETIAKRKAAAQLAQAEQARAEAEDEPADEPGVLAIAPPDEFEVVCEAQERDVVVGRGTSFPLVFVNRGSAPVEVELAVTDSPEGWSALATEEAIELEARSSRTVYVIVRPPAETPVGEQAEIAVGVRTSDGTEETIELVAEVVEEAEDDVDGEEEPEPLVGEEAEKEPQPLEEEGPEPAGSPETVDVEDEGEPGPDEAVEAEDAAEDEGEPIESAEIDDVEDEETPEPAEAEGSEVG